MCVSVRVHVCVHACVSAPRLFIIWTPYDWSNKFCNFYMAALVNIISRQDLIIEGYRIDQPNKTKPALYKLLVSL